MLDASKTTPPEPDLQRALQIVMEMMAIRGGSGDERPVANFIRQQLRAAKVPARAITSDQAHQKTPEPGNQGNLVVSLPGTTGGPGRLLSAHMDTVPLCLGSQPRRSGRKVSSADPATGLGADNRAGSTAILCAALEIMERKLPHPPLTFCWFVQEETALQGVRHVSKTQLGSPQLAFNWDGSNPVGLVVAATGAVRIRIEIRGLASHAGGAPEKGISAIAIASRAIADLDRAGWHGQISKSGKQGTSNVGFIRGGAATNVVTDRVTVHAEARSHDPAFRTRIVTEIEKAFRKATSEVQNNAERTGKLTFSASPDYESYRLPASTPSVVAAAAAIRSLGRRPAEEVSNGGYDANWLITKGIPSITMGCGMRDVHTVRESLSIPDFETACRLALRLATAA
jgi:tripeptide aminopeptidase